MFNIGINSIPLSEFLSNTTDLSSFKTLLNPKRKEVFADPFIFNKDNKTYLFFEQMTYDKNHGVISVVELQNNTPIKNPVPVIQEDYHLSYPFIFEYENEIFCMPESNAGNNLTLYKATDFPYKWEKSTVLFNEAFNDATLHYYDGYWWLFYTLGHGEPDTNKKLYIKYATAIFGDWQDHPQNPVKEDITSARSAGKIFEYNGMLIRPAQDCLKEYGHQLVLNKITKLTTTHFEEEIFKIISPSGNGFCKDGIHHISFIGDKIGIDGYKKRLFLKNPGSVLKNIIDLTKKKLYST